jgi:hypothetical protein
MSAQQGSGFRSLSVVVPVSGRYDNPREVYESYRDALCAQGVAVEFIYVIDGPYPKTFNVLAGLQARGEPIRIVQLARHFGEATALSVGFHHARGDALLTLPAFHQVDAAELPRLLQALRNADMVVGRRWPRADSTFNRLQTGFFAAGVRLLTRTPFHDLGCNVRALRRKVCEEVLLYGDQQRFLPILAANRGFRVVEIDLAQSRRDGYRRVYRPGIYLQRAIDVLTIFFLTKFTRRPMRFFGLLGSATAGAGALYILVLVFQRLFLDMALADRPALLLSSLLVVLGVQIFAMGLIGELIIFAHARQLTEYAIDEVIEYGGDASAVDSPVPPPGEAPAVGGAGPLRAAH